MKYFLFRRNRETKVAKRNGDSLVFMDRTMNVLGKQVSFLDYYQLKLDLEAFPEQAPRLKDALPLIDMDVFEAYDKRESEIEARKEALDEIKESKTIFGRKKSNKLIYVENHNYLSNSPKTEKGYYLLKNKELIPIEEKALEKSEMDSAVRVTYKDVLEKALKDDFKNQFEEAYNEQIAIWESVA